MSEFVSNIQKAKQNAESRHVLTVRRGESNAH